MDIKNVEDIYQLSPVQQALLFFAQQAPNSAVSFEQVVWTPPALNVAPFVRAWRAVLDCHAILRTAFFWEDLNEPVQVVCRQVELPVEQLDWQALEPREQQQQLATYLEADRRRGVDLTRAPLMRLTLIRLNETNYQVIWSYHHILLDGWSVVLVLEQVQAHYAAFQEGRSFELPAPRPFRDYIAWLRRQDWRAVEAFWRKKLEGVREATALPWDQAPGSMPNPFAVFDKQELRLSPEASKAAQNFARHYHITVNTLIQAIWATLLSRYNGESDIVFGLVVHGRPAELSGFESMVGLFINGLPIQIRIPATGTLLEWLNALQPELVEVRRYGSTPLAQIQGWLGIRRNKPMFDCLLVDQSYRVTAHSQGHNDADHRLFEMTGYPLTLYLNEGNVLTLQIAYDLQRFDGQAVAQILEHLRTLLVNLLDDPHQPMAAWSVLTPEETRHILFDYNQTTVPYPHTTTLPQLFAIQARRTPQSPAIVWESGQLTYAELDSRTNQLAHYLHARGVGPDTRVGLCLRRSADMIIGLLGILKAGGAYVPLDPAYPAPRLTFMMQDAQIKILLTQTDLLPNISAPETPTVCLDGDRAAIDQESAEPLEVLTDPANLAYIIYTSGSTGQPKGVMIAHQALVQYVMAAIDHFAITPDDRVLQFASLSFDTAAEEIYPCLLHGAALVLRADNLPDSIETFLDRCAAEGITVLDLPTAYWHSLMAELESISISFPPSLRLVILGGEAALPERLTTWQAKAPAHIRLVNTYGPTETTIVATRCDLTGVAAPESAAKVPIGQPIANTRVYVLDPCGRLVPVGVPGELYIGGAGLARGYLNRPALTAAAFVPDPFGQAGQRLYKTGDKVRYLPDGNLEFLGRVDQQVKIRGFRVELGEVEAVLRQYPAVREAVAIAQLDLTDHYRLVAYIVADETQISGLRDFLRERLPEYMVPSVIMPLEALPLSPNGKIDRRVLPTPEGVQRDLGAEFVPPETALEIQVAKIWSTILHVQQVGILDNFFDLGGDSLLATQVMNQVNRAFQVRLSVRSLIEQPTVADLALLIEITLIEELETATA